MRGAAGPSRCTGTRCGNASAATAASCEPGAVWVHAVSLGETRAAAALIDALRELRPGMRLLLTHGTATGRVAGQALLREGDVQAWLPLDTPGAVRRFLRHFRPSVGVLMETEIWPNLLHASAARRCADGAGQRAPERKEPAQGRAPGLAAAPGAAQSEAGAGADRRRCDAAARERGRRCHGRRKPEVRHDARPDSSWRAAAPGANRSAARSCSPRARAKARKRRCSRRGASKR